jgi:hypothetical protein
VAGSMDLKCTSQVEEHRGREENADVIIREKDVAAGDR